MRQTFTKSAYGPADAAKVLSVAKQRILPRGYGKQNLSRSLSAAGASPEELAAVPAFDRKAGVRAIVPDMAERQMAFLQPHLDKLPAEDATNAIRAVGADMGGQRVSGIHMPVSPTKQLGQMGLTRELDPSNKRMLESVIKGHELDELQVAPKQSVQGFGHWSPDVLFREHNRIMTLPPEFQGTGDAMRTMRDNSFEAPALKQLLQGYGFDYGKSPRVSRHLRRAMTDDMERMHEMTKSASQAYAVGYIAALSQYGLTKEAFAGSLVAGLRAAAPALTNAGKAVGMGVRSAGGAGRAAVGAAGGVARSGGSMGMAQAAQAAAKPGMAEAGNFMGAAKQQFGEAKTLAMPHLREAGASIKKMVTGLPGQMGMTAATTAPPKKLQALPGPLSGGTPGAGTRAPLQLGAGSVMDI